MQDAKSAHRPPVTRLRPLHTRNEVDKKSLSALLSWTSSLGTRTNKNTILQGFVKLVSQIIIVDSGEAFCIQYAALGGYIHARAGEDNQDGSYTFVHHGEGQGDICTDFSIGSGKSLQLHMIDGRIELMAQASMIPQPALDALGQMLQDIILHLQKSPHNTSPLQWTQPSVLNHPPQDRPIALWPGENQAAEPALLHRRFEQRVRDFPQRVALDFLTDLETGKRTQYTYQQVSNIATALALDLYQTSCKSNAAAMTVAVHMGPCPELYVSYIAALKVGLAFCPIPIDAPYERKAALLEDLKPVAVLEEESGGPLKNVVESIGVTRYLDACDVEPQRRPSFVSPSETDAAYILYTSGTTGIPKGVIISHISAACTISALSNHYGFCTPGSLPSHRPVRWFQGAAPTFDISLFEIFWTLSTGSTLCCAARHLTMQDVDKVVTTLEADITNVTPSFASLIDPRSMRGLMVGGETLNTRLLQDFSCYNPSTKDTLAVPRGIYNGYGPTEVTIYSVAQAHVPKNQRGSVIGTPLLTCGVLIVDTEAQGLEPVPMGADGELVLTGAQVSRTGYLNRPEETTKVFIDDPKWGRAYRTGDRARIVWNEQGEALVEFLGRISDGQVKLSGRRVELGEIESVLASKVKDLKQVLACVWKPKNGSLGSEKVVSLVVVDPKSALSFEVVKSQCLEAAPRQLPEYMVPVHFLQVDTLPQSTSGKVDRKAASAYVQSILHQSRRSEAQGLQEGFLEQSEDATLEADIIKILSDIICDDSALTHSLKATTLLSEAGVDSLCAMRLLRDIRNLWPDSKHLQPSLGLLLDPKASIRSVFGSASAGLAMDKTRAQRQIADFASRHTLELIEKLGSIGQADIEMVLPATSTQSQLAVSFAMDRRNYVSHTILPLRENVSLEALEEAVNDVLCRQAIYRCALVSCDDELSPFSLVVLKPDAWHRWTADSRRVVRRQGTTTDGAQECIELAHQYLDLESQKLFYIQIVESEGDSGLVVISLAHCLCDGASLEVLLSDISREYTGLDPLPRLGIEDAVLDWVSCLDTETDKQWREALRGWEVERFRALSGNNINSSNPGVPADYGHAMVQIASDLQWQTLEASCKALGASPLSVLQASWSLLLQIFSEANTGDIVFGSVISGQHEATHAPTFSVAPCRVALPDRQTVGELLDSLIRGSRFAQRHRHMSFGTFETLPYNTALALQAYSPPKAGSDQFRTQDAAVVVPWAGTGMRNPAIRYDFDIFVEVFPADPGPLSDGFQTETMSFKLTYRNDALSYTSARVIVKQLEAMTKVLLNSKADDLVQTLPARLPRGLLSAEGTIPLPMEEPQERIQLLHAQFEKQAAATPDLFALSFYTALDAAPVELTYAELDVRANGLANILREEDVDIIPICIQRSVELYISILAILKAGSAWSPIDETSPIQRRTSLIARTQGKVLLTNTNSFHLVEPCLAHESLAGVRVILVDQYVNHKTSVRAAPRRSIQVSRSDIGGQDLAYLLWTSGTTGEPKGVMIQHFAAANAMRDLQVQVERDETVGQVQTLQLSSYSFDVFVQDLFFTWGVAGSVISGTRELILGTFTEFVNKSRPTHAHLTPSFGASIDVEEIRGSTLQYVTFIGEKLTEDVAEAWAAPGITTKAYNTYGPAENAVVSTMRRFFGKSRDQAKAANVGFPLATCTAYVVRQVENQDDAQKKKWELVPRYGVGELALGGGQVGKGYLNDEAKTSRAFIQGGHRIGERIYLTGDMVRLNDHGFEFLGRNDDLVKITGIRIELSEISAACATVKDAEPGVEHLETLYLPRPGACGGDDNHKVVVTFVSIKRDGVDTARVRTQVFQKAREVLPAYMIPGHVVVLDTTMPRTASNKVDRKALQNIYNKANLYLAAGREVVAGDRLDSKVEWPEDQLHVVKAIAENFKVPVEPLSPDDSLASLGFSSLQVTKLAWALRRQLKCTVGVLDLMRCQTLGELVDVVLGSIKKTKGVEAKVDQASEGSLVRLLKRNLTKNLHGDMRPKSTSYILPATPVQESLLVETMVETGAYWSHRIFDLSHISLVDSSRLKASWSSAATQFDILRTVFAPLSELSVHNDSAEIPNTTQWARQQGVHATMVQLILNKPIIHWTTLSNADTEGLTTIAEKIQVTLAPLGTNRSNPPWAVTFSEGNNKMMLSMHHTLHDGVASSMILESVASLYLNPEQISETYNAALQMERGMELGLLPSISQRDEALSAWTKRLHGLVEADGALNGPFPDLTGSRQKQKQTILSVKQTIPGRLLEHRAGEPDLPRLVQSAFGCALAGTLELKTIVLGQTVSQRILHPDIARVVGPAMATLPVIVRAHASSAEELWADMGFDASSLSQSAHRLHPVDIKKIVNEGSGHRHAPFPALFVYHPTATADDDHIDVGVDMFREIGQALPLNVEHPMALNIFEADSTIELTGDARLISQPMLELMLDQILDQARAMLDHPRMPLKQLSNHMNRELMSICGKIGSLVGTDITRNPADLVTKQAAEHPDWIAVEEISLEDGNDEDDQIVSKVLTYAELEVLVNAIATALRSHESKPLPDDVVALYLGRDTKSLAAILATFKCGYMYLPIDGDLPAARKQLLVRDANAKLVLTTQGLVGDLNLDSSNDPPALFLPEGDDELEVIRTWPNAFSKAANAITTGEGGYLLYTSGSTGRPKGVSVTNESLLHFISAMTKRLIEANVDTAHLGGVGKYLNVASRAFDTHLTSMFAPWHLGFRSVIGKDRNAIFASLQQVINKVKITHMGSVPSVLMQLGLRLEDVPSMRVLTFGGEKASHELFEQLNTGNPKAALMNFYGPTEVTIGCLSHIVGPHSNSRNLGVPLRGLEAILLVAGDDGEQVVARKGQPGEFCIAGPQVAVGYLDRPEENAKGFQYTRLLGGGGEKRIYRTGDIMRMMHDGSLEFLGRRDQQTKIRGQRFEISEVEAYIKKTVVDQGPLDVAATVVDQRLVGFLARKKNTLLKAELNAEPELLAQDNKALQGMLPYIEQACREGLPAFMVPEMMWVSKIPYLAASGKTDSKSLIKLANDFMALQQGFQVNATSAPHPSKEHGATPSLSNAELEVVAALQEVVGCQVTCTAVSTSSIRSLGIDSLLGVHLIMVLKKRGFVKATMVDLLSPSCTVGSLARTAGADVTYTKKKTSPMKELLSWTLNDLGPNASSLNGVNVAAVLPCLPLQSPLVALSLNWLDSVSDEENSEADMDVPYVTQFNYQLAPGTDVAQWKAVATKVVFSEAILRTCFIRREEDGKIFQVVLKSPPSPFDGKDDAAAIVAQISSQPPIRLQIQSDQESGKIIVLLKIHHALYDGIAIASLRKKLEQAYANRSKAVAFENQSLHSLQRLANHCHLTEEEIQSVKRSWQTKLRGIQPCRIGRDTEEGTTDTTVRVRKHLAYTSTELKAKLQQGEPVSMSTAFQLATSLCLAYLTKRPSVAYGFTMSLRPLLRHVTQDVDDFVGPCLNTVVHTLTLEGASETLPKLAQKVHQGHVDACQGHMPLVTADKIQQWANLKEKLFDSLLTINVIPTEDESSGARCTPGHMTPLPGKSRGDLALAIDVDLHADGMIVLSLASAGAMTEAQLEEVGILFEKIVFSSSNKAATVEQFASVKYETTDLVSNGIVNTKSTISRPQPLSKGFESALACVQSAACHLLHLDVAEMQAKSPETTSLYQLGIDSINVLPFVKLIHKAEGIKLAPNALIRARTVQGVAALLHQAKSQSDVLIINGDKKGRKDGEVVRSDKSVGNQVPYEQTLQQLAYDLLFIATPLQEGMLSASMAIAEQAYMYTHTMQLSQVALEQDTPNFDHFFAAVKDTVHACEILRSRFIFTQNDDAPWVGVVSPTEQSDLVNWYVSKAGLVQLTIHHALYDAVSIQAVWRLLNENYRKRLTGEEEDQDDQQVAEYLFRSFAKSSALAQKSAVAFWTSTVHDYTYEPVEIAEESLHASSSFYFTLADTELLSLQTKCREANATLKAAMQLGWAKVLCESLYKQADVVFGEVITASGEDSEALVIGPVINTIPVRLNLTSQSGASSIHEAMSQLQTLGDNARGANGMASLRAIQRAWRSSRANGVNTAAGLFQSLFVFDGVIASEREKPSQDLLVPVRSQVHDDVKAGEKGPAYDDYPFIVSFRIKDGTLHGALRAKLSEEKVNDLGKLLENALRYLASEKLQISVLDLAHLHLADISRANESEPAKNIANTNTSGVDMNALTGQADAVLEIVKEVVRVKIRWKGIGYKTKLVNIGLDSMSAIRFSKILKKKLGLRVSVFEIIRGASVEDIARKSASVEMNGFQQPNGQLPIYQVRGLEGLVADKLGLVEKQIKSVSPVLSGQRHTLQQWLHNGKRFFEAPWVYRIHDESVGTEKVASYWVRLSQVHEILRTTFVYTGDTSPQLVQVTLDESVSVASRFSMVLDTTISIQELIQKHVREGNAKPSNLKEPPARLSLLKSFDGIAVVFRVHHALYDAWSIKMILKDLTRLFANESLQPHPSIQLAVREITNFRQPEAEKQYWKMYLSEAQDTIVHSGSVTMTRLGPHFKAAYTDILPRDVADGLDCATNSKACTSAAIIIAYAHALGELTGCVQPIFGLNHSSRSLTSAKGEHTLDLTAMSVPTMAVVPLTVDLKARSKQQLFEAVQDHLAQLTKFAQADNLQKLSPKFNSYINILYSNEDVEVESQSLKKAQVLQRHKLGEPLASEYFTQTAPSSIVSTVDGLDTSAMHDQQFYFNILVHQNGNISVNVSGNEDFLRSDQSFVTKFMENFGRELCKLIEER